MLNQSDTGHPSWASGRIHCTACGVWGIKWLSPVIETESYRTLSRHKMETSLWCTWNILLSRSSLMFPRPYKATEVVPWNIKYISFFTTVNIWSKPKWTHLFNKYRTEFYLTNTRTAKHHFTKIVDKITCRENVNGRKIIL